MVAGIGDRILVHKANGKYDIYKINEAGERERVRDDITPLHQAWEIARGSMTGTKIWLSDEQSPNDLKPYHPKQ
jgi:hypothetical protein